MCMVWYSMVWYGMVSYGMVWYGMVWYGMVWYGMVWYILGSTCVQCPLTSSLGEFPGIGIGSVRVAYPGFSPVLVFIAFSPSPSYNLGVSPPTLLRLQLNFNRVSSLRPRYLHPFGRTFIYSLFK